MKKKIFPFLALVVISVSACNNADNTTDDATHRKEVPKTLADSLMADVMDGHDAVMPKMGKIRGAQKKAQQMLDSIAALPAKAKAAASDLKMKLEALRNELNDADFAMDRWMSEFNMDSAINNAKARINYLMEEKLKVTKVKASVLNGLAKADSLLKK